MKSFFVTTLTAGALASAALGLAGTANAAPSGPSSVDADDQPAAVPGLSGHREPRRDCSA